MGPISISKLAEEVRVRVNIVQMRTELTGIVHIPYETAYGSGFADMDFRCPNVDRLKKAIGFVPSIGLDKIIMDIIDHEIVQMAFGGEA